MDVHLVVAGKLLAKHQQSAGVELIVADRVRGSSESWPSSADSCGSPIFQRDEPTVERAAFPGRSGEDVQAAAAASVGPRHRPTAAERRAAGLATGRGGCRQRELGEDSL